MQDRYVGDVGDFGKYALLRKLCGDHDKIDKGRFKPQRLGIVWCYFPDETHNNDGRHISYLSSLEFRSLDKELAQILHQLVTDGRRRVSEINASGIFPKSTVYCEDPITQLGPLPSPQDRLRHRSSWLDICLKKTKSCDLVFFDPDNGTETASVPKSHPKAGKYVYWDELSPFWERGQNLLVYHHLNRTKSATSQIDELGKRIQTEFSDSIALPLVFRRGSCRVFWLIYRPTAAGNELARRATVHLSSGWAEHFHPLDMSAR